MKVILTERVKTLGNVGEIVNVSAGYARNYLLPNELAMFANEGNKSAIADQQRRLAKKVDAQKKAAEDMKQAIEKLKLEFVKKVGANGSLFGTVTSSEIAKELEKMGIEIERRQIVIDTPIKQVGEHKVKMKVFPGIEAVLNFKVTIDPVQAEEMKKKQEAAREKKKAEKIRAAAAAEAAETAPAAETEENA
jgi:large subunit ribosomal protein L9